MGVKIKTLLKRDNYICHYCKRMTDACSEERYPTKDHIVPRAFGGPNSMSNYVLACYGCNQKRGTSLFYCKCRDCHEKILDALYNKDIINGIFDGMIRHNRPRLRVVRYRNPIGKFQVRIGHHSRLFATFEEAIAFATTGTCINDKEYN